MTSQSVNLKMETMEKDAIKRNKYDYDRIMREYDIAMRLKRMKDITETSIEKKQKLEQEKLKQMEEKREKLLSKRIHDDVDGLRLADLGGYKPHPCLALGTEDEIDILLIGA